MATDSLYESLFLSLGEPAFVINRELRFVDVNRAFERLTGLARAQAVQRPCADVLGTGCASGTACILREAFAAQSRRRAIESLTCRDGERRFLMTATVVRDPSASGELVMVVLHDANLAAGAHLLAASEGAPAAPGVDTNMRILVGEAPQGILVIQDERVQFANDKAAQLTRRTPEELLHRRLEEIVQPDDRFALAEHNYACLHGEAGPTSPEFRTLSAGGETRWVRGSTARVDWNDRPALLLFLSELDEDRAEQELHRRSEARFKALFDNVNDAIFIHDMTGHFLEVNAVACARLGYSREELLGMMITDINVSQQTAEVPKRLDKIKREGSIVFDTEHLCRDGSIVPSEISSRLYEYAGRPAMLSVARDTTERRRLTEEIIRAQKMETIGLLAGGVAHDFNNILSGVLGLASLINRRPGDAERCRAYSGMIEDSVGQAAELTTRLLALARQSPPQMRPVDLNRAIDGTLEIVARTFQKEITVEVQLAADLPTVVGDDAQLAQATMNLCLNARDAMPEGGTLRVWTEFRKLTAEEKFRLPAQTAEEGVILTVEDTGDGIAPEDLVRIFDPFFTTKAPGKGTGLGLSTVHWVVKNHGGCCHVDSVFGKGTSFRICMPAHGALAELCEPTPRRAGGRGELLLLVDDDETVRLTCKTILREAGYRVMCAADGREGLEMFRQHREEVALVLLDVIMPHMGGTTCLAELRRISPELRVVIISGYEPGERTELGSPGVAGYLQKPFGIDQLANAVRRALDDEPG